jgi:hypothetical protein
MTETHDYARFETPWSLGMQAKHCAKLPTEWQMESWSADELERRVALLAGDDPEAQDDVVKAMALGWITIDSKGRCVAASDDYVMVIDMVESLKAIPTIVEPER